MDKNNTKKQNVYVSEEEKTLNWEDVQNSFKKSFLFLEYKSPKNLAVNLCWLNKFENLFTRPPS